MFKSLSGGKINRHCIISQGCPDKPGSPFCLMAAVVCCLRWRDACMRIMRIMRFMRGVWGRHDIPLGFAVPQSGMARAKSCCWGRRATLWQRWYACRVGVTLKSDLSDLSDKMGAPVFALTGYAVASLGILRGFAVPQSGMARVQSYR